MVCEGQPRAVQRKHRNHSMTGNKFETTAKGVISRSEVYEYHNDTGWEQQTTGLTLARQYQVPVKVCNLATRWEI